MRSPTVLLLVAFAVVLATPRSTRAQSPTTVVILVRHAEKADEAGADPALSAAGEARARALADTLRDANVGAVLTTPYKRTNLTAAPLAMATGLTPIVVPVSGGLAAYAKAAAEVIRGTYAGRTVLVVGHANTIPALIAALGGPKTSDLCESEYSMIYRLTLTADAPPKLDASHYGAPDAAGAAGCRAMMTPTTAPSPAGAAAMRS